MKFNWRKYCFDNKLSSNTSKTQAYNHYINKLSNATTHHCDDKLEIFRSSLNTNKNILFFCHTIPTPDLDSGSNRIFELLKILIEFGYNIYYLTHDEVSDNPRYKTDLYNIGVKEILVADQTNEIYCDKYVDQLVNDRGLLFDIAIFEFYEMYNSYWDKIKYIVPNIKTIVDTVDVHWVRKSRNPNLSESDVHRINIEKEREKNVYNGANVIFAVTENDKKEILKECPLANVKIVSNIHDIYKKQNNTYKTKDLIFVGGDNHTPNTDAALRAITIFLKLLESYPQFKNNKLHIVGKRTNKIILSYQNHSNIIVHNNVTQDKLDNLYTSVVGALCPLSWGAGIKGKICEAISNGVPVITTPIGAEGINLVDRVDAMIGTDDQSLLDSIVYLWNLSKNEIRSISDNARKQLSLIVSKESASTVLGGTLTCKHIVLSIVTHNNKNLLRRCIESILAHTTYPNYTIYVTSNACKDDTPSMMQNLMQLYSNIQYQYNDENKHFIQAHNDTINKFNGSDIVLLNEDIEFLSNNWLSHLYSSVYSAGYIGCAGGKTFYPNGKICEAGAMLFNSGDGYNIGRNTDDCDEYNKKKYVGYVSGCIMYMRRDAINKFGPMDMLYYPCYYEDSDWQYNLHINGYKTIYDPRCCAIHREGSSCGIDIDNTTGFKRFMKINKLKFVHKFQNFNIEQFNNE